MDRALPEQSKWVTACLYFCYHSQFASQCYLELLIFPPDQLLAMLLLVANGDADNHIARSAKAVVLTAILCHVLKQMLLGLLTEQHVHCVPVSLAYCRQTYWCS